MKHLSFILLLTLWCCIKIDHSYATAYQTYTSHNTPTHSVQYPKLLHKIAVIGTGYVGLVTGVGLAEFGNTVVCADIDKYKIEQLANGNIPIYEPGLKELIDPLVENNFLSFTHDVDEAIYTSDVIFIAVGTPMDKDGSADLRALESVMQIISQNLDSYKIIVTKSTVPVGTGFYIRNLLEQTYGCDGTLFDIVSNPEFLREGSAVQDFLHPDRIVIGAESDYAFDLMCLLYKKPLAQGVPHVLTNIPTAELIKYASNAFLATKLSFINEMANICDATGAHVQTVARAMGLDNRISSHFLQAGPGYGGSCFPKDTQALVHIARKYNVKVNTVEGAIVSNLYQQHVPVNKLLRIMDNDLKGKTVAVLGLAFKANTDDIRYSPAITALEQLKQAGAHIQVYDPQATKHMKKLFSDITYCTSVYDALHNADALILMTEWDEFKHLSMERVSELMQGTVIVDARNIFDADLVRSYGFTYDCIGQACL